MPIVTNNYMLSLTQDNRILRVRCSQNDTSRQVNFTIYNNGTLFTIPSGLSVSVHGIKQNGNIFTKSCTYSGSVVTLVLGTQITNTVGISVAELVFTNSSGGKIGTSNFIFQVESDPLLRGTIDVTEETPTEYISDLVSMIEALSARVNNIIAPSGEASLSEVVDARLSGYSGTTYQNLKARIDADFAALDNTKADKSDTYTKEEVDAAIDNVTITTDETLSVPGAAADAKKTGDAISEINGSLGDVKADLNRTEDEIIRTAGVVEELECGLTEEVKIALLACFAKVAWIGADGQTYYEALEEALNRAHIISSISAVFNQGSTVVYDTDELYSLKQYLTVTATYDDGTMKEVNNYTLNGELVSGISTITVAYNKKTTTFNVNVTHQAKTLESISATFNSSASITTDNALDDLRPYLTVRATYSDGSTDTITNYALSGSLNAGTNTITVTYNNKTATFTVNVTEAQVVLQSISASFNQGSTAIYTDNTLNDLKPYLTVTARYSNGTTQTITNYTLSGTLATGTSTITASYGGKTATFNVTVTASPSDKELSHITANFAPGTNKIYESKDLNQLRQYLTVTARYSDSTVITVTNYTLFGDLIGGQLVTIGVNYTEGNITKQTSFAVEAETIMYDWDFTTSVVDTCANKRIDEIHSTTPVTQDSNGLNFTVPAQVVTLIDGDDDINHLDMTVEIDVASFDFKGDSTKHVRFFMDQRGDASNSVGTGALIFKANFGWTSYGYTDAQHTEAGYRKWSDTGWGSLYDVNQINALNGKTVKIYYGADGHTRKLYLDGTLIGTMTDVYFYQPTLRLRLGGGATLAQSSGDQCYDMTISGVRIYRGEV